MSFTDITIQEYSRNSIVVQGETRKYKEDLKKIGGGKYNGRLTGGPGWIFPNTKKSDIQSFIKKGQRLVSKEEQQAGEELSKQRAQEWQQSRTSQHTPHTQHTQRTSNPITLTPTITEYSILLTTINKIYTKVEKMEHALMFLLTTEQKEALENIMNPPVKIKKKIIKKKVDTDTDTDCDTDSDDDLPPRRLLPNNK